MAIAYYGTPLRKQAFLARQIDVDGALNRFEIDTDPTADANAFVLYLDCPLTLVSGRALSIYYTMNPTNAATYTLYLGTTSSIVGLTQQYNFIWWSAALQADSTVYHIEIDRPFRLAQPYRIYYALNWTAAPGNTIGWIVLAGEVYQ